jgi:hypothetical protein
MGRHEYFSAIAKAAPMEIETGLIFDHVVLRLAENDILPSRANTASVSSA